MPELITTYTLHITTTGSDGSAVGSANTGRINGELLGIYFDFHASAPATTDTTVQLSNPTQTILTLTDTVTDVDVPVRAQAKDSAGAGIAGVYDRIPINGVLTISVAGCNALTDALVAYVKVLNR